jgi:hypothetical protein
VPTRLDGKTAAPHQRQGMPAAALEAGSPPVRFMETDDALENRLRGGDGHSFVWLVQRYQIPVRRLVRPSNQKWFCADTVLCCVKRLVRK